MDKKINKSHIVFLATTFSLSLGSMVHANENTKQKYTDWILEKTIQASDFHAPVYSFLIHKAIPGNSDELSTRMMSVTKRNDDSLIDAFAFHSDTGINDRFRLCLRSDAAKLKKSSSLMLHYAVSKSDYALSGISLILNWNFPRGDQGGALFKTGRGRVSGAKNASRSSVSNSCSDCIGAIFLGGSFFL